MNEMSIDRLRELFTVSDDGRLIRKITTSPRAKAGHEAGHADSDGYLHVDINYKKFMTHRIVFAMTHGRWPTKEIDHINGIKSDNRPDNLREATNAQNKMNTPAQANNRLGIKGVYPDRKTGRYRAFIAIAGKQKYLGVFTTLEAASGAYKAAAAELFGEFAYD